MRFFHRMRAAVLFVIVAAVLALVSADYAEARRGGGFGSRGARTFTPPAATQTAPNQAAPINRSMTAPSPAANTPAAQRAGAVQQQNRGMFGGLAGGLLGGLMLGGLIGLLMGGGLGGFAGFLGLLLQVAIIGGIVWLVLRLVRGRREAQPALAGAGAPYRPEPSRSPFEAFGGGRGATVDAPRAGAAPAAATAAGGDELGLGAADFDRFEQLLVEIQAAFAREDYGAIRARATPEIVSFLSEELSENATRGVRNDVADVKFLEGDLAEAWREGNEEFATVAMRYSSVDVMRDRQTGAIVDGDAVPTETTEIWTFVRPVGGEWKLSAIQDV
jgi:predicted lipid-binding transport protein (Tim44 family)